MSPGSTSARCRAAEAATMPSCTAVRCASAPPRRPKGVRAAERITVWDTAAGYRAHPDHGCGLLIPSITNAIRLQRHGSTRARILRERPARSAPGARLRRARRRQEGSPRRQLHRPCRSAPVPPRREVDVRRLGLARGDDPDDFLSHAYPVLVRALSNLAVCVVPGREARFLTPEQGNYGVKYEGDDDTFLHAVAARLAPLAESTLVVDN